MDGDVMDGEWIEHDGGACPVDGDVRVEAEGYKAVIEAEAGILKWENIKRYRIVKEATT